METLNAQQLQPEVNSNINLVLMAVSVVVDGLVRDSSAETVDQSYM
jgi:hypothetical protein